jgi:phage gpG-like protein
VRVIISSHGFEFIESSLRASAGRADFLRPALEEVADDMMDRTETVFDSEGRQAGTGQFRGSWAQLADSTIRKRIRAGYVPIIILHQTGRLRASVTQRGDPDMTLEFGRNSLKFGSRLSYADTHQHGTSRIPARPFIVFGPQDQERWSRTIASYIIDPLIRRGR